ncbi:eukaryotic translation initiation factor 1-like [Camelus dromedarius]|uniref:eukaryotic translation initiation factor 1-like n=1 Tax=Camelus dromedarius TaxID=9838 RepID=UPI003119131B
MIITIVIITTNIITIITINITTIITTVIITTIITITTTIITITIPPSSSPPPPLALAQEETPTGASIDHDRGEGKAPLTRVPEQKESHCSSTIQNLQSLHPFTDASKSDALLPTGTEDYNYIRIRQSNSRKTLTTVQGFADDYNKKKLVKMFKEKFACNGTVMEHSECGELIQPRGDQQKNMSQFLTETGLTEDDQWKAHGF